MIRECFDIYSKDASREIVRRMNMDVTQNLIIAFVYLCYAIANTYAIVSATDESTAFLIPIVTNGLHLALISLSILYAKCFKGSSYRDVWPTECPFVFIFVDVVLFAVLVVSIVYLTIGVGTDGSQGAAVLVNVISLLGVLVCFYKTFHHPHTKKTVSTESCQSTSPCDFEVLFPK